MNETLDLAKELNCEFANFYSAMAYPGSELYSEAVLTGQSLPREWSGFSQHSYDCFPLATKTLTSAQVLAFRDTAFNDYFTSNIYLDMIGERFGQDTLNHVMKMASLPLKRGLLEIAE